jgi:hypothetical protein
MPTSREYRQFARECIRWAAEATTDEARDSFLDLASDWTFAALVFDRVEKQEPNLHAPTPMGIGKLPTRPEPIRVSLS